MSGFGISKLGGLSPSSQTHLSRSSGDKEISEYSALKAHEAKITPARQLPEVDRSKVDPQLREAAEGMEAMFIDYMMKVMRQTVPKNDLDLESPATEIYRSMMDTENSKKAAHAGGVGLSDQIIAYLDRKSYHLPEGHAAPVKEKP